MGEAAEQGSRMDREAGGWRDRQIWQKLGAAVEVTAEIMACFPDLGMLSRACAAAGTKRSYQSLTMLGCAVLCRYRPNPLGNPRRQYY